MPKILIIDDDADLFSLLSSYLESEGFVCSGAADGQAGLEALRDQSFDLAVLDVMLPVLNGFEVLRRIRANPESRLLPVLMLTARGEEIDRVVGLELGADDYLSKPFSPRELVARIRALLRRLGPQAPLAAPSPGEPGEERPQPLLADDISLNLGSLSISVGGKEQSLSLQEIQLLEMLLKNSGRVVARDDLYRDIFGHPAYFADRSLDMLVSRLRKKLGPRPDGRERIKAVRGQGYIYLLDAES
ncbi:response regulator transcription factor [Desulfovibrio sp. OttesenSCG-928-C14]|nr:response regulator transcription factor [Desulfovibrio sp. OttesenSCG-928-C14]